MSDPGVVPDEAARLSMQADHKIIDSSLHFIDDFLRSMLLMYRASSNKLEVDLVRTNLYSQVFEPVVNILQPQQGAFEVLVDCPPDLEVLTDALRLKQVLLNLVSIFQFAISFGAKYPSQQSIDLPFQGSQRGEIRVYGVYTPQSVGPQRHGRVVGRGLWTWRQC